MSNNLISNNNKNIHTKVISGTSWLVVFQGLSMILRFGSNLILAWLLAPESFGLMALITVFILGLQLFSDVGIKSSMIRSPHAEKERFYNTAWTIQIIRGLLLWIICLIFAVPISEFYEEPTLSAAIPVAGLTVVILGFQSTSLFLLERQINLKAIVTLELTAQLLAVLVTIIWANLSPNVWALVAGGIVNASTKTIISHFIGKTARNKFAWSKTAAHEIIHFGKWIFVSTAFGFLAMQSDRLIIGKLFSIEMLGVYHIALQLTQMPLAIIRQLSTRIIYPLLSHYNRENNTEAANKLEQARKILFPSMIAGVVAIMIGGRPFFETLYKEAYHGAGWITSYLAIVIWIDMLMATIDRLPLSMGNSKSLALAAIVGFLSKLVFCLTGFYIGGLEGFIIGLAIGSLCAYGVIIISLKKIGHSFIVMDIKYSTILISIVGIYYWLASFIETSSIIASTLLPILFICLVIGLAIPATMEQLRNTKKDNVSSDG